MYFCAKKKKIILIGKYEGSASSLEYKRDNLGSYSCYYSSNSLITSGLFILYY